MNGWLIAAGIGLFVLGTGWGWVLHMAYLHPVHKRGLPGEDPSDKMEP